MANVATCTGTIFIELGGQNRSYRGRQMMRFAPNAVFVLNLLLLQTEMLRPEFDRRLG